MISLLFAIIFFILFIFLCIVGGNHLLRKIIDNVLSTENFENQSRISLNKYSNDLIINPIDDCKKIDEISQNNLNFQTATNIPLSPYKYKNFIGSIYIDNDENNNKNNVDNINNEKYCLKKNKLLYDGIWNPIIKKDSPYEYEKWDLTNGDISDGYYCSDKLIEINNQVNVFINNFDKPEYENIKTMFIDAPHQMEVVIPKTLSNYIITNTM